MMIAAESLQPEIARINGWVGHRWIQSAEQPDPDWSRIVLTIDGHEHSFLDERLAGLWLAGAMAALEQVVQVEV